ncbi:LOW QUALITY PROTEIN: transmembrane protein 80-like [Scomber scombrus]|uniref:LOW QUALITY PROTEIN: transmembrane protein 80-like n=1 Tax=Scomber scombrus TaxID=13677 RepID=A0AAV1NSM0_SCOSC
MPMANSTTVRWGNTAGFTGLVYRVIASSSCGHSKDRSRLLPSVTLQVLLKLTTVYFVFYFLFTLSLIIRKSLVLSYPVEALASDVSALFLLAALEFLHFFCGQPDGE